MSNLPVKADRRAREHFRVIGAAMAAKKEDQRRDALRTSAAERVAAGILIGHVPIDEATARSLDERALGQIGLARRRPKSTQ